jgi:uncharacterized protein YkwD
MVVRKTLRDLVGRALLAGAVTVILVIAAPAVSSGQDASAPKRSHAAKAKHPRTSLSVGGAAAMISRYRRRHGLPAVKIDSRLMAIARHQARAMAAHGRMSHDVGGDFSTRLRRRGYAAAAAAENIAAGQRSLSEAFSGWVESSPHRANLLLGGATRIGIASAAAKPGSRYRTYWAMVIAAPLTAKQRGRLQGPARFYDGRSAIR